LPGWVALIVVISLVGALACDKAESQDTTGPSGADGGRHPVTATADPQTLKHKHTNRLINATSPYLLQHAHNPVDWYEWGPEALARARKEDKPIFLSIGYSACHWCHVMERESFENEEIAAIMNTHFVCIKVDREERPDLDDIYMAATQALTRSGGWPMSVWLTPDCRPFFAGTYFPPEGRYGRPGFKDVLLYLHNVWENERENALDQAGKLTQAVRQMTRVDPGSEIVPDDVVPRAVVALSRAFDPKEGGLGGGGTNKFPPSMAMDLLLRVYHRSIGEGPALNARLLQLVELTLEKMAHGGIYDHLGGGIARYSTDPHWLVPHFEKMLYDQALVSGIYLKAYQLTKKPLYERTARGILDYVIDDLQSPEGGYYSTRDADSEGVEGKFYVWSRSEITNVLGETEASLFCDYYDVSDAGNWEGHNILNVPKPAEEIAKSHGISIADLDARLEASRKKLFAVREKRVKPHLDDKILSAWNGLMITSMAEGYRIFSEPRYRDSAVRAADFVLAKMSDKDGRLFRSYRAGRAGTTAYLDDYAFMIDAALTLYETTFDAKWLDHAVRLNGHLMAHYRDSAGGGFFFTADDAEKVLVRAKNANDGATPSGSSVHLMNLQRLAVLLDRKDLAEEAEIMLRTFGKELQSSPFSSERMLAGVDFYHRRPKEIAFVCKADDVTAMDKLIDAAWQTYVPNAVFARLIEDDASATSVGGKIPLLKGKKTLDGKPTVYVCKDYACQAPTTAVKTLIEQISK
jgi:uncharacterized protein YyaL (SSP411 family)